MILHLSAQQTGGAAIAALRIHMALLQSGQESHFLAGSGAADPARLIDVVPRFYERYWQRGFHKIGIAANESRRWQLAKLQHDLPPTVLGGIRSDRRLSDHPLVREAQIIHLHWITGMFDWPDFFENVKKPIVWTLHDMNPFLGVFHYEGDRERSSRSARAYDRRVQQQKARLLGSLGNIICVAPSQWLSERAKGDEMLRRYEHRIIRNTLDTQVFRAYPPEYGREVFELPKDKKLLLVVAERLDDYRKGMDLLNEALAQCGFDLDWEVIAVGARNVVKSTMRLHHFGPICDARLLALLYSTADLFVAPSREDNFPNTILESLCCGTPVVGLPAGGIPEAVQTPRDGVIAKEISGEALAFAVKEAAAMLFDRKLIRQYALERFIGERIAAEYQALYGHVLREGVA